MNKVFIASAIGSMIFAAQIFAAESNSSSNVQSATFEKKQLDIIKNLNARISILQEAKTCVQSANNNNDINVCKKNMDAKSKK